MIRIFALACVWLSFVPIVMLAVAPTQASTIAGVYGCTGTGQDGASYQILMQIEPRGTNYILTWRNDNGEPTGYGFGTVSGDVLSVFFQTPGGAGLSSYTISKTALTGRWAPLGAEETWPETCLVGGQAKTA